MLYYADVIRKDSPLIELHDCKIDLANAQVIWEDKILPLTAGKRYARHFLGVFEAATIHYAVAKIFGPLFFNPACSLR